MPIASLHNENELLQQVAAGDRDAFTLLFHHYRGRVDAIAYTITRSETASEELLQEIFMTIWINRQELGHIHNFQAYLFITIRNRAYNLLKRQARLRKLHLAAVNDAETADHYTEHQILERDFGQLLEQSIHRLPPQQQQVFRLSREQGLNRYEIAQKLRLSPNTVKTHLSQALKNLRALCISHAEPLIIILLWMACA